MDKLSTWSEVFIDLLYTFWNEITKMLPSLLGAILIFLIGWLFARLVSKGIGKLLEYLKFNDLAERVNTGKLLTSANISAKPSALISKFIYYIIMLLVIITASDTLGWSSVSEVIKDLVGFLPNLLAAIVIFIIGVYIASTVRDFIIGATATVGSGSGKIIGSFIFYLLIIMVSLTALDQAGMDTTIISNNMILILSAILLTASISYGLASRDVLSNILAGYVGRETYRPGLRIEVNGIKGVIVETGSIGVTIKDDLGNKVIIPSSILLNSTVKIHDSPV